MAIIFPTDPAINDEFTLSGKTWRWDGSKWNLVTIPLVLDDFVLEQDVLTRDNTDEYTPTADFHPSTKKYVDDGVAAATIGAIDDIGDVVITSPQDGESLVYDDGLWINTQVSGVQNIDAGSATTVFSVADINIDGGNA